VPAARVVLAPDKFKGTLTADEVVGHLAAGIRDRRPDVETVPAAVADGGDGLLDACVGAGFERVAVPASDATGRRVRTWYARRGDTAVVELAAVAGLARLGARRAPLTASSRGVGEVIAAALDAGCGHVVLGVGGSASTDGGAGMLRALGARLLDAAGNQVADGGAALLDAARLELTGLRARLAGVRVDLASDVDNPLTGDAGAAAVYGPQKGADERQARLLDAALTHWADLVAVTTGADHRDEPGAGAAGGVGFAALAVLGAVPRPGARFVLDMIDFPRRVRGAALVVTGEGRLDEQTLRGKAPAAVCAAARAAGVPVVAVAGACTLEATRLRAAGFDAVYTLLDEAGGADQAMRAPGPLLRRVGARVADRLAAAERVSDLTTRARRGTDGTERSDRG
jgi:glycerate kinase